SKIVIASAKSMPCLRTLAAFLASSHSKSMGDVSTFVCTTQALARLAPCPRCFSLRLFQRLALRRQPCSVIAEMGQAARLGQLDLLLPFGGCRMLVGFADAMGAADAFDMVGAGPIIRGQRVAAGAA